MGALLKARGVGLVAREGMRAGLDKVVPGGAAVPLRAGEVTPEWLEEILELRRGAIRSVSVVTEDSGTAARARLAVVSDDDVDLPEHVFLKFTPRSFQQRMMMLVMGLGTREVFLYQTLGGQLPVRMPKCYAARVDVRRGRNIMLLEDLAATALFRDIRDPVSAAEAESVVDAMAAQHAAFWNTERFRGDLAPLVTRFSPEAMAVGNVVRRRFLGNMKGEAAQLVPDPIKEQGKMVYERSDAIDAFWASEPQTVLHGDPHFGNLFFEGDQAGFIDWQVARAGCGIRDVSYFATASIDPTLLRTIERGLVERYVGLLDAAGIAVDLEHQWNLYRAGLTDFYGSAVAASEAGDKAQDPEITRVGVERVVASIEALDSFTVLEKLIDGKPV